MAICHRLRMKLGSLLGIDSPGQYFESDVFSASLVDMALSSIEQLLDREENKKRQAEAAAASTDGAEKSLPEPKRIHLSQSNSLLFPKLASTKRDHSQFADERGEQQVKRLNARGYPAVSGLRLPHWQPPQPHDESDEDDIDAGPAPAA